MAAKKKLPEIRQCEDQADSQFGSSATAAGKNRWLVANPVQGGHWATDDEVKNWTTRV